MKKTILTSLVFALIATSALAADIRHPRNKNCAACHEAPLSVQAGPPVEPVIVAVPGLAVTTYPWLTQSYNPLTNPVEFGLQFIPHVRLGVGTYGMYR